MGTKPACSRDWIYKTHAQYNFDIQCRASSCPDVILLKLRMSMTASLTFSEKSMEQFAEWLKDEGFSENTIATFEGN